MATKDDNSPLSLLVDTDPEVLKNIVNLVKSGSKRRKKTKKRKKSKRKSKTKIQKKKKKSKSKRKK